MQMRRTRSIDRDIRLDASSSWVLLTPLSLNHAGYPSPINYYLFPLSDCPPAPSRHVTSRSSYFLFSLQQFILVTAVVFCILVPVEAPRLKFEIEYRPGTDYGH